MAELARSLPANMLPAWGQIWPKHGQVGPTYEDEAEISYFYCSFIPTRLFVRGGKNSFTYEAILKKDDAKVMKLLVKLRQTNP
jgi:hypothetical protein